MARVTLVALLLCAASCDDAGLPDDIDPNIFLALSERHMNGRASFDFVLYQDGTAVLSILPSTAERWMVSEDTRARARQALLKAGFAGLKREYLDPDVTCGGHGSLSLNDGEISKTVVADGGDPDSKTFWEAAASVRQSLGLDEARIRLWERWKNGEVTHRLTATQPR